MFNASIMFDKNYILKILKAQLHSKMLALQNIITNDEQKVSKRSFTSFRRDKKW